MNLYQTQFFRITAILVGLLIVSIWSCKKEDDTIKPIDYGYTIAIESPTENSTYSVGDTLPIGIKYSSTTGEIVHYISVEIYNKYAENKVLYSVQSH